MRQKLEQNEEKLAQLQSLVESQSCRILELEGPDTSADAPATAARMSVATKSLAQDHNSRSRTELLSACGSDVTKEKPPSTRRSLPSPPTAAVPGAHHEDHGAIQNGIEFLGALFHMSTRSDADHREDTAPQAPAAAQPPHTQGQILERQLSVVDELKRRRSRRRESMEPIAEQSGRQSMDEMARFVAEWKNASTIDSTIEPGFVHIGQLSTRKEKSDTSLEA